MQRITIKARHIPNKLTPEAIKDRIALESIFVQFALILFWFKL